MSLLTAIKYMQAHDAREPAYASMIGLRVLSGAPPARTLKPIMEA
jgi:hypothetical protein